MTNPTGLRLTDHEQGRPLQASAGMSVECIHHLRSRRPFWLAIAALTIVLGATYVLIIRPSHLCWGTTDQELALALPGAATTR
jgi:hypothetical protein